MIFSNKELLNDIESLEKENMELLASIKCIDNKERFETVKHFTYRNRKEMYRKIPFEFIETVFYSHKNILLKHANGCFIDNILDVACIAAKVSHIDELVMSIPMYCNDIIITGKGLVFVLSDPYRIITTKPITNITKEAANTCKDRILVAQLVIPENHRAIKSFELKGYRLLKMTLTNIIGKSPVSSNKLITQYKNIKNEDEAIKSINAIENHYNKLSDVAIYRLSKTILRILTSTTLIGISYEKGQLWYAEESSNQHLVYLSMNNLPSEERASKSKYCFVFSNEKLFPLKRHV